MKNPDNINPVKLWGEADVHAHDSRLLIKSYHPVRQGSGLWFSTLARSPRLPRYRPEANDRLGCPAKALVAQHKVAIRGSPNLIHQSGLQFVPEQLPIRRLPPFRILSQCRIEPMGLAEHGCITLGIGPVA